MNWNSNIQRADASADADADADTDVDADADMDADADGFGGEKTESPSRPHCPLLLMPNE